MTNNTKNRKKPKDLKSLAIDEKGKLTLEGKLVEAVPIDEPKLVCTNKKTRERGYFVHGDFSLVERTTQIPSLADSYVLGKVASMDYAPIQYYKIKGGIKWQTKN